MPAKKAAPAMPGGFFIFICFAHIDCDIFDM
jgi:hypothetical protein